MDQNSQNNTLINNPRTVWPTYNLLEECKGTDAQSQANYGDGTTDNCYPFQRQFMLRRYLMKLIKAKKENIKKQTNEKERKEKNTHLLRALHKLCSLMYKKDYEET